MHEEIGSYLENMKTSPARLTDEALLAEVKRLAQCERETTATLIAHLVEVEARELFHAEGCSSMFKYCSEVLHFSEHATYLRLRAARAARRHPRILDELASGALNLSSIEILEPHLTSENYGELLGASRHKSKREVEKLVRSRFPQEDVPTVVRKLPEKVMALEAAAADASVGPTAAPVQPACTSEGKPTLIAAPPVRRPSVIAPLATERYKVQFTASEALHDKLRRAQDLLRHRIPDGDVAQVFELAVTLLVEKLEKQKFAATDRPRAAREGLNSPRAGGRTIPAEVKRAVWKRDGSQCTFIGKSGRRCTETGFLEFHHVDAFGHGGKAMIENIALRCRSHNQYESRIEFGMHQEDRGQIEFRLYEEERARTKAAGVNRTPGG